MSALLSRIIFDNDHFIVVFKQAGELSVPSRFANQDDRDVLGLQLQEHFKTQIFPVHRLDFEVSGLVLYAKNKEAHAAANGWFENKIVEKTYRALTSPQNYSHIPATISNPRLPLTLQIGQELTWKCKMLRGKRRAYETPAGKSCETKATYIGLDGNSSLIWDLKPVTGRGHQLRFDLSRHGFCILGDQLYGSRESYKKEAIALMAYRINFVKVKDRLRWGLPEKIEIPPQF